MEPGIKKLTEAVKRDCREGQGCFNPNGCDHEFIRHVPETDPSMIRLGQKTKCIKVSKCAHKYCDKYKWVLDRAEEYAKVCIETCRQKEVVRYDSVWRKDRGVSRD